MGELRTGLLDLGVPLETPLAAQALTALEANGEGLDRKQFGALVKQLKSVAPQDSSLGGAPEGMAKKAETVGDVFRRFDRDGSLT